MHEGGREELCRAGLPGGEGLCGEGLEVAQGPWNLEEVSRGTWEGGAEGRDLRPYGWADQFVPRCRRY